MVIKTERSLQYEAFEDGESIDRRVLSTSKDVKIIKHEATVHVRYLVEFGDGTRDWFDEVALRPSKSSAIDEDEDEDEDDCIRRKSREF